MKFNALISSVLPLAALAVTTLSSCSDALSDIALPFQGEADGKWGLVRADGSVLYDEEFKADLCPTVALCERFFAPTSDGDWQLYAADKTPTVIGSEKYASVSPFQKNVAIVAPKDGKVQIIDRKGKAVKTLDKLSSKEVLGCQNFDSDGYAVFSCGEKGEELYGLIDRKGKVVIEPKYCVLSGRDGHYFAVDKKQREDLKEDNLDKITIHVLDRKGKELYSFKGGKYETFYFVTDGYMAFVKDGKGAGLLNPKGKEVLAPKKEVKYIYDVRHDAVIFNDGEGCGVMDIKGNVVVRPKFETLVFASDRLLWASVEENKDNVYKLYDLHGRKMNDEAYKAAYPFYNGDVAFVRFNDKEVGIVDDGGKDYSADVFLHNVEGYDQYRISWIEPDQFDVNELLSDIDISEDQLGAFRCNMTTSEIVSAYKKHDTSADDPIPENYCYKTQLSYDDKADDVSYDVDVETTAELADYNIEWDGWDTVHNYYWTNASVKTITLTLRGGAVSTKARKVYDALVAKVKKWGDVYEKGTKGTSIDLGRSRGYVITYDDYSVTLTLYNNNDFKYASLSASEIGKEALDSVRAE